MRHLVKVRDRRGLHLLARVELDAGFQNDLADPTLVVRQFGQHPFRHIQITLDLRAVAEGHVQPRQHVGAGHGRDEGLQRIQSCGVPIGCRRQRVSDPQGKLAAKVPHVLTRVLPGRAGPLSPTPVNRHQVNRPVVGLGRCLILFHPRILDQHPLRRFPLQSRRAFAKRHKQCP